MTEECRPIVAGVDTHKDTHYAAVISVTGEHLAAAEFPATQAGYQALQGFITCHGVLVRAGVEGTNSYGAGLSRHLHDAGVQIVEVIRSSRQIRRMWGKSDEIAAHDSDLVQLVETVNPSLVQAKGIATITAAQLLITAGDNLERIVSEAAFAMLCGAAPIPASSGRTTRRRLNRGGGRAANSALHRIALVRLATDPDTRAYAAKHTAEGKSKKDHPSTASSAPSPARSSTSSLAFSSCNPQPTSGPRAGNSGSPSPTLQTPS